MIITMCKVHIGGWRVGSVEDVDGAAEINRKRGKHNVQTQVSKHLGDIDYSIGYDLHGFGRSCQYVRIAS